MANFLTRIKKAVPVWSSWAKGKGLPKTFIRAARVTGVTAAGDVAVADANGNTININDKLIQVLHVANSGTALTAMTDITTEFTITAAGIINNTGGTVPVAADYLLVMWEAWGETFA